MYYRDSLRVRVRRPAPAWAGFGVGGSRASFEREVERLLAEGGER